MAQGRSSTVSSRRAHPKRHYFDLDQANRALVYIGRIVDDITTCYREALAIRQAIEAPGSAAGIEARKRDYERAMDRLNELIDELHHVGVELKDFEKGIVDFPAHHEGRDIYLCWCRGEPAISGWHEAGAGYPMRHDLEALNSPSGAC